MNLRRIPLFRMFRLLLPVLAVLVMQTAMLATMAQARTGLPQAQSHSHDHLHGEHQVAHEAVMPCHESGDASKAAHPLCLALCCLALPLQPELMAVLHVAGLPGTVLLPVLSGVQTIPPSPPPRG